ncbi:hypothetical protein [Bradyrhizobium sp. Tv2a-2]|uniref:hypothetical protein n=1 Tax=Bradyrhizobium sp. Tv2a-2 TaxID=113395 RepID=UPI00055D16DD|nr:hypothetical protein [Bradyrhizobium sp. Tv2a-2]
MSDWQTDLDDLLKRTTTFVESVGSKIEALGVRSRATAEPITSPPLPKFGGCERDEIMKRVESFKAHQLRAIREREEYAVSVLTKLKEALGVRS